MPRKTRTPGSFPNPPRPYRVTFLDRLGIQGVVRINLLQWGLTAFGLFTALFVTAAAKLDEGIPLGWKLVWVFACTCGATAIVTLVGLTTSEGAGRSWTFLMVDGAGSPYEEQFSREQALVMQGRVEDALHLLEERIAADPRAIAPRLRAAELHAREAHNPGRAAELFREVQRMPAVDPPTEVQATMRLVDLYLGPLDQPGRALVELRRLVDRHPRSAAASHAREAIARLKADGAATDPRGD